MPTEILETIDTGVILGEGVVWNEQTRTVWWTDIQARRLFALTWPGLALTMYETPERLGSFGFIEGEEDRIVAAFESGFALFAPHTGDITWLDRPAELTRGRRLNDGRVGPDGRFWAGSMIEKPDAGLSTDETGFYCLDAEGKARLEQPGLEISNGLCWSPDGSRVYFSDSPAGEIYTATYDKASGQFGARDSFATLKDGGPDGAITDAEGHVWSAIWGGNRLTRFSPEGDISLEMDLPVPQPTCPVFGGADLDLIFVTTATEGLSEETLETSPAAGSLLILEAPEGITGLPGYRHRMGT